MKKLLIIFLSIAVFLPLFAQENEQPEKKSISFARRYFELGFGGGAGFANDLLGREDIFRKEIILDANEIDASISEDGINLNADLFGDFFITVKDISIGDGKWNIGIFSGTDGRMDFNIPKNLVTLIAKGNHDHPFIAGMISASGAVFAETGFDVSAKYGKLKVGLAPALFSPMLYIPKSGLSYTLDTHSGVFLSTSGDISVYSPFVENGELRFGLDVSTGGTYDLFSFLDVGGSLTHIPIAPPTMRNRMRLTLEDATINMSGKDFLDDIKFELPDLDFKEYYDSEATKVFRPFRLDIFARYKPIPFSREFLVIRPNMGFSVDINNGESYFNAGLQARLNLIDLFLLSVGSGREEGLWKQQLGLVLNLRAFELGLEASLRSQNFKDSFKGKGFGVGAGVRFGW